MNQPSSSTYISLVWVPVLPLDALHHVYINILGITASLWLPHGGVWTSSCTSQTRVHIPLLPSSLVPLCICVCCGRLSAGSALPCYMQGSQDVSIDRLLTGHGLPPTSPLPCQQGQLQPLLSISPSLTERCDICLWLCFSGWACFWCP